MSISFLLAFKKLHVDGRSEWSLTVPHIPFKKCVQRGITL